jgi:hypothetical protein
MENGGSRRILAGAALIPISMGSIQVVVFTENRAPYAIRQMISRVEEVPESRSGGAPLALHFAKM